MMVASQLYWPCSDQGPTHHTPGVKLLGAAVPLDWPVLPRLALLLSPSLSELAQVLQPTQAVQYTGKRRCGKVGSGEKAEGVYRSKLSELTERGILLASHFRRADKCMRK